MKKSFLFVYGTLLQHDIEYAVYLKSYSTFYKHGRFRGRLYDIGEYPGAITSTQNDELVYGSILQIGKPIKVLPVIDDYEGFGNDQPQPNEFIRKLLTIQTDEGELDCWIYLYNLPVDGFPQIVSGRY